MQRYVKTVNAIGRWFNIVAGICLISLMGLTILDVILRAFNKPIVGTYEMVALAGAIVIGFAMPQTALLRAHIYVDTFVARFSGRVRNFFHTATRLLVLFLLLLSGGNLLKYGWDLQRSGEVSLTLQLPFYPVCYGLGICFFVQSLVVIGDIIKIQGGTYDE